VLDPDRQIAPASAGVLMDSIGDGGRDADYEDFAQALGAALREAPSRPRGVGFGDALHFVEGHSGLVAQRTVPLRISDSIGCDTQM
jgi:hypothetical protein